MVGRAFKGYPPVLRFRRGVIYLLERPRGNMVEWYLVKFIRLGKRVVERDYDGSRFNRYAYHFLKLSGHEGTRCDNGRRVYTIIQRATLNKYYRVRKFERSELALYLGEPNNTKHFDEEVKSPQEVTTQRRRILSAFRRRSKLCDLKGFYRRPRIGRS